MLVKNPIFKFWFSYLFILFKMLVVKIRVKHRQQALASLLMTATPDMLPFRRCRPHHFRDQDDKRAVPTTQRSQE